MTPIAIAEGAQSEGRALFAAVEDSRDLFKDGRAEVEKLKTEAKKTIDGVLSKLCSGDAWGEGGPSRTQVRQGSAH